ncbi:MAG: hypothetical protein KME45_31915 [Stenomitos rutilans HA7619-LM2]|jgi:hypothetical protein|nr:hypothetical protein [Stenomitos rutilans HA7619-LM2]
MQLPKRKTRLDTALFSAGLSFLPPTRTRFGVMPTGKACAAWRERSEVPAAPMDGKASVDASGMSCANSIHPLQI